MIRRDPPLPQPATPTYASVRTSVGPIVLHRMVGARGAAVMAEALDIYAASVDALNRIAENAKADGADFTALAKEALAARFAREQAIGWVILHMWADPVWELWTATHRAELLEQSKPADPVAFLGGRVVEELWDAGWEESDLWRVWASAIAIQRHEPAADGAMDPEEVGRTITFFGR